jgi:fructose-1,6-bisphosphatase/inositol monophosphatase family enzyme
VRDEIDRLLELQERIREALRASMAQQSAALLARTVRDGAGDTTFGIDADAERILLPYCEAWSKRVCFELVAEGLDEEPMRLGRGGASGPAFRLIVDPIDGTRGLMFDKRSAWSLAAIAPADDPRLGAITCAAMTELPTTRQGSADRLWAERGGGAHGERVDLARKTAALLPVVPSAARDFRHGFASVVSYFQGGKELVARIEEDLLRRERGGWNPDKAEIYTDQYICSGGQLAEIALGRDRFVLDVRPLVHRRLGVVSSLCSRPYDLCTALIAQEAGCVVTAPDGAPLDAPLDTTTNMAFVGYANRALAERVQPMVAEILTAHGLLGPARSDPPRESRR